MQQRAAKDPVLFIEEPRSVPIKMLENQSVQSGLALIIVITKFGLLNDLCQLKNNRNGNYSTSYKPGLHLTMAYLRIIAGS